MILGIIMFTAGLVAANKERRAHRSRTQRHESTSLGS
jgi:hypothetical protein